MFKGVFHFFTWEHDKAFAFLPLFYLSTDIEVLSIGWLSFRIEIHYDKIGG